jgi:hypothetical protein
MVCNLKSSIAPLLILKQLIKSKDKNAPAQVKTKGMFLIHASRNSESIRLKL